MKKFLVVLLAALMVFSLAACGGGSDSGSGDETASDDSMKVAMVTDYGDITDFEDGRDMTIKKSGTGLNTEYSTLPI